MKIQKIVVTVVGFSILAFFIASVFFFLKGERFVDVDVAERRSGFSGIFPSIDSDLSEGSGKDKGEFNVVSVPLLRQITTAPIAGAYAFGVGDGKVVVRYVERETGHVLQATTADLEIERISNETVARVHEALFVEDGKSVIMRYLDGNETIKTIYRTIERDPTAETGNALFPNNIPSMVVSKDTTQIFYLTELSNGANGYTSSPNGTERKLVFTSPIKEWLANWSGDSTISLNTKPSNGIDGLLFLLNSETGEAKKRLSKVPGLISLTAPDSKNVLYSENDELGTSLTLSQDKSSRAVIDFTALAEKCVWSELEEIIYCASSFSGEAATYPDDWYKGLVSFGDDIWVYDVEAGVGELFFDLEAEGQELDITNMFLDEKESHIFFTNKKDLTLWSLRIKEPSFNTTSETEESSETE